MSPETMPAIRPKRPEPETSFTRQQRDTAYHCQVERYVAWARELLDPTPGIIDSEPIRERRVEAASAVLDVLWATIARHNLMEDDPMPLPGLIVHKMPPELRRLVRRSAS